MLLTPEPCNDLANTEENASGFFLFAVAVANDTAVVANSKMVDTKRLLLMIMIAFFCVNIFGL